MILKRFFKNKMFALLSFVFLSFPSQAQAASDELSLDAMLTWRGQPYEGDTSAAYMKVTQQLCAAIANTTNIPNTYGIQGIGIDAQMSFSFIDTTVDVEGELARNETPSSWALMTPDESPSPHLWIPEVQLRKGLPFSFELGTKVSYIGGSKQGAYGVWGKFNPLEGSEKGPEVALQFGYSGLVGSDELSLGVRDISLTIGKSVPFGPYFESNTSHFIPFLSVGKLKTQSIILSNNQLQETLDLDNYSSIHSNEGLEGVQVVNGPTPAFASIGMHFLSNDFRFQIAYRNTFGTLSSMTMSLGFLY